MKKFKIRPLNRSDFASVSLLISDMKENIKNQDFFVKISDEALEDYLVSGVFYGAFKHDELIGVAGLELDECPYMLRGEYKAIKWGELMHMVVRSDYRGRGVISQLCIPLIEKAKELGYGGVCASMHPANLSCVRAFAKLGDVLFIAFDNKNLNHPYIVYGVKI